MGYLVNRKLLTVGFRCAVAKGLFLVALVAAPAGVNAMELINFAVTEEGVYRVTHSELLAEGVNLTGVKRNRIGLHNSGSAVPRRVNKKIWDSSS